MNYLYHYKQLIKSRKKLQEQRLIDKKNGIYFEDHHIIPVSICKYRNKTKKQYNKSWNRVLLTAREHFIAHMLLWKICVKQYGEISIYTKKCTKALSIMGGYSTRSSVLIQKIKILNSLNMKGCGNPNYNAKSFTIETSKKISIKNSGKNHWAYGRKVPYKEKILYSGEKHPNIKYRKKYKIFFCDKPPIIVNGLKKFCKDNNYSKSHMSSVLHGRRNKHKNVIKIIQI